jgi:hypothetical protein
MGMRMRMRVSDESKIDFSILVWMNFPLVGGKFLSLSSVKNIDDGR